MHVLLNSCTGHHVFLIYKVGRCWVHVCNGMESAMYSIVESNITYDDSAYPYYVQ